MVQQGQTFELTRRGLAANSCGRTASAPAAATRSVFSVVASRLNRMRGRRSSANSSGRRRERRITRRLTFAELVETYLGQHDVQPVTIEKLRYLLSKATAVFGDRKVGELTSEEIAAWDDDLTRLPLRSNPGAATGAPPGGGVG